MGVKNIARNKRVEVIYFSHLTLFFLPKDREKNEDENFSMIISTPVNRGSLH